MATGLDKGVGVGRSEDERIRTLLEPGEEEVSRAKVKPPGAIERQSAQLVAVVLTNRRLLILGANAITMSSTGKLLLDLHLDQIETVSLTKRHPVMTLGVPVVTLRIVPKNSDPFAVESSGIGIGPLRKLGQALEAALKSQE
jgi:hypothetical protein